MSTGSQPRGDLVRQLTLISVIVDLEDQRLCESKAHDETMREDEESSRPLPTNCKKYGFPGRRTMADQGTSSQAASENGCVCIANVMTMMGMQQKTALGSTKQVGRKSYCTDKRENRTRGKADMTDQAGGEGTVQDMRKSQPLRFGRKEGNSQSRRDRHTPANKMCDLVYSEADCVCAGVSSRVPGA